MKKAIFVAIFISLTLISATPVVKAQTFSTQQEVKIRAITQQISDLQIQILLAKIAELQAQITELLAKQTATQTQLGAVQGQVQTVVTQTAPAHKSISGIIPISVSFGTPYCDSSDVSKEEVTIPVLVSGNWDKGEVNKVLVGQPSSGFTYINNGTPQFVVNTKYLPSDNKITLNHSFTYKSQTVAGSEILTITLRCQ